jgi:uncharacterized protein (DUF305 family)
MFRATPPRKALALGVVTVIVALTGCSASPHVAPTSHNSADSMFIRDMMVHHGRALQLGQLASTRGADPRVRSFGSRIVREQTPEYQHLQSWVTTLGLTVNPTADSAMASGYVSDTSWAALMKLSGPAFDKQVLLLSAASETGAVTMAEAELAGGTYKPALALATSIEGAKGTEIPELRKLAQKV